MGWMKWRPRRERRDKPPSPVKAREPWSRGDKIAFVTCVAAILAVPGLLEVFHVQHAVAPDQKTISSSLNEVQPPTVPVEKPAEPAPKDRQEKSSGKMQAPKTADRGSPADWAEVREENEALRADFASISDACQEASKRFARCSLTLRSEDSLRDAKSYMNSVRRAIESRDIESARKGIREAESKIELLRTVCSQHPACGQE